MRVAYCPKCHLAIFQGDTGHAEVCGKPRTVYVPILELDSWIYRHSISRTEVWAFAKAPSLAGYVTRRLKRFLSRGL